MTMNEKQGAAEWLRGIIGRYKDEDDGFGGGCSALAKMLGIDCNEETCRDCMIKMMTAIADRIDAERAIPDGVEWPRFEDGEIVNVGDEVEYKGETMRVYLATFDADGWALWCSREGIDGRLSGSYGERVKRPAPKVLDADGVEIRKGDVLYSVETGDCVTVGSIELGNPWFATTDGALKHCAKFTHQRPVLDADGAPIEVGDTVYFVDGDARPLTVERIDANGGEPAVDLVYAGQILSWHSVNPDKLTHERPDSWEKLEEDARKTACNYAPAPRNEDGLITCDGCPFQKSESCSNEMTIDLVERAKKLACIEEEARND